MVVHPIDAPPYLIHIDLKAEPHDRIFLAPPYIRQAPEAQVDPRIEHGIDEGDSRLRTRFSNE